MTDGAAAQDDAKRRLARQPVAVELSRPAPYALVTAALIFAGGMFLLGTHGAPIPHATPIATGLVVWLLGSLNQPRRLRLHGRLEASDEGLFLDGVTLAKRSEIGWQERCGDGELIIVDRFGRQLMKVSGDEDSLNEVEDGLGASPGRNRVLLEIELPQKGRWDGRRVAAVAALAALMVTAASVATPGVGLAFTVAATLVALISAPFIPRRARTLRIGADGLAYASPGRAGFLRFREGQRARAVRSEVVIEDATGQALLRLGTRSWFDWTSSPDAGAVANIIQAGIDAPAIAPSESVQALVPPAEGSVSRWLTALSDLAQGALATHRTAAPSSERLLAAVASSHESPLVRIGAAHMLVEQDAKHARGAVRRIAANTADHALRDTLELLASDHGDRRRERLEVFVEQLREREAELEAATGERVEPSRLEAT